MNTELHPVKIGTGNVVHAANLLGRQYKTLCNAKPNRTGGILRSTYPTWEGSPITCQKCLQKMAQASA